MKIGVDIGRVIMCPADDAGAPDTSFLAAKSEQDAMQVPAAPGCFTTLNKLVSKYGEVALISKAGYRVQHLTRKWLQHNDFYNKTGINSFDVHFCKKRPEKAVIAAVLNLTHFIDDRLDVLEHLRGVVPNLYLFGHQKDDIPDWVNYVENWQEVEGKLL